MSINYNSVAVIGGDKRQLFCAKAFEQSGFGVSLAGFDKLNSECNIKVRSPYFAALSSQIIVLPIPCVRGNKLNAPYASADILFDRDLLQAIKGKKVFCGIKEKLFSIAPDIDPKSVYDYSVDEGFLISNAVATAEGAVQIAMQEYEGTINSADCLVCGYGRIGKVLARLLTGFGANVTVTARKHSDMAWISTLPCSSVYTDKLYDCSPFDIIFNTVPALVFDDELLQKIAKDSVLIDLASYPGGVDFESASRLGISAIHALSLPGKTSPKTAGKIIKDTIIDMLEEDYRCAILA